MLITDLVRLSTRMFRTNKSRTILTILGISVGIGTILFLVSLGYGLQHVILSQITTSDALLSLDVTTTNLEGIKLDENTIESISSNINVAKISPLISKQSRMKIDGISSEVLANFADEDYFKLEGTLLLDGEFYNNDDNNKVLVSQATLLLFNIDLEEAIGKKINFVIFDEGESTLTRNEITLQRDFEIAGIIEEEVSSYVYLPLSLRSEIGTINYSKLKVKVDREENLNLVRENLVEQGYVVSALSDIIEQANQIFKVAQIVLALFGVIALIVSAIGMFNTMTIALLERTQEIGIMKALGATSLDVWEMFLSESVIIGFTGGMGGILIGLMGGEVFNYIINTLAGAFGGNDIDLFFTPLWFGILVAAFSTIVGLITGFYPAKRAASISSLEALRYK